MENIYDAKTLLSQAWYCYQAIEAKLNDIERLRSLAEKVTTSYSIAPANTGTGDRIPDAVARIIELQDEIGNSIEELRNTRKEVEQIITENFPAGTVRVILYRRYILTQRWERIATEMCYSIKWIWKLHGRALAELNKKLMNKEIKQAGESD